MEEVHKHLFVGDDSDYERLKGRSGWSFLRACKDGPDSHRQLLGYTSLGAPQGAHYLWVRKGNTLALNLIDIDDPNFIPEKAIDKGLEFIAERLSTADKLLVSCNAGHSRSAVLVLLFLRSVGEYPYGFIRAEKIFKTIYPKYDPNAGMRHYARAHWNGVLKG